MKYEDWKELVKGEKDEDDSILYMTKAIKHDEVSRPAHYNRSGIEAIKAIEASMSEVEFLGYLKGNILKYIWRYGYKDNPKKDIAKARWYLDLLYERIVDLDQKELSNKLKNL